MAQLLDLPTELLAKILLMSCPSTSDIAKTILVCKLFRAVLVPELYRQIDIVISFVEPINFEWYSSRIKSYFALKRLFLTLATREDLALFVTDLSLLSDERGKIKRDPTFAFNALTFGPHQLDASQVVQALQNLKALRVDYYWSDILLRNPVLLPRLETAGFCQSFHSRHDIGPCRLMIQPKLKEITLQDVHLEGKVADFQRKTSFSSNVSHLTLTRPRTGVNGLAALIRMMKHLRSLKLSGTLTCPAYSTSLGHHNCRRKISARFNLGIRVALKTVEHCLEVLMVTNFESAGCYDPALDRTRIETLHSFRNLRAIKIGVSMILGTRRCPTPYAQSDALHNNDEYLHCEEIARCMPASLQRLYLTISREQLDRDDQYCMGMVNSFLKYKNQLPEMTTLLMEERRPHYTPRCRCVVKNSCYTAKDAVESSSPVDGILQMQRDCSKSGIELSYFARPGPLADERRFVPG